DVQHVPAAVGAGLVGLWIRRRGAAKEFAPPAPAVQAVGELDGVPGLVAQDAHAFSRRVALGLEHLGALQAHKPLVGQVKRDGNARRLLGREPLVGEPDAGAEAEAAAGHLAPELVDSPGEPWAVEAEAEIAQAHLEQALIIPASPDGI